jgi:phosphinothricin acetyltransferase
MLRIYNHAILTSNATFDLQEQTLEERQQWFTHYGGKFPLIVAEEKGQVLGYCGLSSFRSKPAYTNTAEVSIYVDPTCQGKGIGKQLMAEILKRARKLHYHVIIAGITGGNEISIKLHEKFGFQLAGIFREVGYKFDQWQDVHFYQLILNE